MDWRKKTTWNKFKTTSPSFNYDKLNKQCAKLYLHLKVILTVIILNWISVRYKYELSKNLWNILLKRSERKIINTQTFHQIQTRMRVFYSRNTKTQVWKITSWKRNWQNKTPLLFLCRRCFGFPAALSSPLRSSFGLLLETPSLVCSLKATIYNYGEEKNEQILPLKYRKMSNAIWKPKSSNQIISKSFFSFFFFFVLKPGEMGIKLKGN